MTAKELAVKLNDSQYDHIESLVSFISKLAKNNGLVIVYGASDNLMEFRGAIYDEFPCYEGGTAYLNKDGLISNEYDDPDCPYYEKLKSKATFKIEAKWSDNKEYIWIYKTSLPHETFDIWEGDEKYCRGIVFSIDNLER